MTALLDSEVSPASQARWVFLVLAVFFMLGCGDGSGPEGNGIGPGQREGNVPSVDIVMARHGSLPLEERITGRVRAHNQTEIYPEVAGTITAIHVENGDEVDQGDALIQLRADEYEERYQQAQAGLRIAQARTRQAEANLQVLESELRRTRELTDRNLETRANLETIESQVAVAEADVELRRAEEEQAQSLVEERRLQVQNTTIRAPISGTVGQRNAEIGQLATTTSRLLILGDLDKVRIDVMLTERMLDYIREGMTVNLHSESWPDRVLQSTITRISPFIDPATLRTEAHVELDNGERLLRPGMFLTVDVLYGESEQAVLIPNSALYRHPRTGMEGVYVVQSPDQESTPQAESERAGTISPPQSVSFVPVDIVESGRMASGVTGIEEGDWVVTVGQNLLEGNVSEARARLVPWDRMMELQSLQSQDLLEVIERQLRAGSGGDS